MYIEGLSNGTTFLVGWYSIAGADISSDQAQVLCFMCVGIVWYASRFLAYFYCLTSKCFHEVGQSITTQYMLYKTKMMMLMLELSRQQYSLGHCFGKLRQALL